MATSNNMSKLLNKIEMRLGTDILNLPENLTKDKWGKVIDDITLETFSRYFPHAIDVNINDVATKKNGYYLIDEDKIGTDIKVLGVRDISWNNPNMNTIYGSYNGVYGICSDWYVSSLSLDDMVGLQFAADNLSLMNNGIYVDFQYPNKIMLRSSFNRDVTHGIQDFYITLLIKHSVNLMTIAPTKMETFEELALCDVATFLYNKLKYFDGLETVFANVDIKLDDIRTIAENRPAVLEELKDGYVSFSNNNQPMIWSI